MQKQRGLSLIELLIAVLLGMLLILGVSRIFISSKYVFSSQTALSSIQETGRLAVEFIARDVRMAGFFGCQNTRIQANSFLDSDINNSATTDSLHKTFTTFIEGYSAASKLPSNSRINISAIAGSQASNILVIKRAGDVAFPLRAATEENLIKSYTTANKEVVGSCIEGLCVEDVAVISNCSKARFFKVKTLNATQTVGVTHVDIGHDGGFGADTDTLGAFAFGDVYPVETVAYYISLNTAGVPALYQKTSTENPVEILEGVESFSVQYLVTSAQGYVGADSIGAGDWSKVKGVKIELVVRSLENNLSDEPQTYYFLGQKITPTDRRQRQVFSTVIGVRGGLN